VADKKSERSQAAMIGELLKKVEDKLAGEDVKVTLADYIRLVQLKKELDEDEPRDIRVTWVEPKEKKSL
jgi:hypothetical protein